MFERCGAHIPPLTAVCTLILVKGRKSADCFEEWRSEKRCERSAAEAVSYISALQRSEPLPRTMLRLWHPIHFATDESRVARFVCFAANDALTQDPQTIHSDFKSF